MNIFEKIGIKIGIKMGLISNKKIPDYLKNELLIMDLLYYQEFTKLSTNESILLFEKIKDNFINEIKNRELSANEEIDIINKFHQNN